MSEEDDADVTAPATKKRRRRKRRTSEEAREAILDATAQRLLAQGPGAIRLQDVARDVGMSHPTVLHHFGSREALLEEVVARAIVRLGRAHLEVVSTLDLDSQTDELLDRVFEGLGSTQHARLLAWLRLSGVEIELRESYVQHIAGFLHGLRERDHAETGAPAPEREDTLFTVLLTGLAAIGFGVIGDKMLESAGLGEDPEAAARFRHWLGRMLRDHLRR